MVFLSFPQNIYESVWHFSIADISQTKELVITKIPPDSVFLLLSLYTTFRLVNLVINMDKMDEIYLQDPNTSTYIVFKDFYGYKIDIGININNFLASYEFLYQKLQKFGMILPDRVQAFFHVKCSKLVRQEWKITRTTCASLNYTTMKKTFKKVFSDISLLGQKMFLLWKKE